MKVDEDKKTAEIDLSKNATYIVIDGEPILVEPLPYGFGKQIIIWQDGKPVLTELSYTKRIEKK